MANFGSIHLGMIAFIFIYDMNYRCAKFYTYISTNMDTTHIFQFLTIFSIKFLLFYPKIVNFGSVQLGIIANIVSYTRSYHYAKIHAFIRKLKTDVIFHWLLRVLCVVSRHPFEYLSIEHRPPPPPACTKTPLAQRTFYIITHLWYQRLLGTRGDNTGGQCFIKLFRFGLIL